MQDAAHGSGEGGWGIGEAESHYSRDEQPSWCLEGRFELVLFFYSNIVIPPSYIELGEHIFASEVHDDVGDEWYGVCVFYCPGVQGSVINDGAEPSIGLFPKKEGGRIGGASFIDVSFGKVLFDVCF